MAVKSSCANPSTMSSFLFSVATLSFSVISLWSQAYASSASAASARVWLFILDGKCSLKPAFLNAWASVVPLAFAPVGFPFRFDSASE